MLARLEAQSCHYSFAGGSAYYRGLLLLSGTLGHLVRSKYMIKSDIPVVYCCLLVINMRSSDL